MLFVYICFAGGDLESVQGTLVKIAPSCVVCVYMFRPAGSYLDSV